MCSDRTIAIDGEAYILRIDIPTHLAGHDKRIRTVIGDAIVLQSVVLVKGLQRNGFRPRLVTIEARHHQLSFHDEIGQFDGILIGYPTALFKCALLPDGDAFPIFSQCHTRTVGSGLRGTVDRFRAVPLCTRILLGVINAIDTTGSLHRLVEMQRVFQVFLSNICRSLFQYH